MSPRHLLCALLVASCTVRSAPPAAKPAPREEPSCGCTSWSAPRDAGAIEEPRLTELSGLAASRRHHGVLYAHNDSGDTAHFFALSTSGATLAELVLDGGTAVDWEDLAVGPCPAGTCVFIGDIGDNKAKRRDVALYRVPEPASFRKGASDVAWERFPFAYPDGPRNAESLLVHPRTGRVYVITREVLGKVSQVFRFPEPLDASKTVLLEKLPGFALPAPGDSLLTGADLSPCGDELLVRMYNRAVALKRPADAGFEAIFSAAPVEVPATFEPQGEAIAWSWDGRAYYTASETRPSYVVAVSEVTCR